MFKTGNKEDLEKSIATIMKEIIIKNDHAIFCLPTGNSPLGIYRLLINFYKNKEISYKNIQTYNLDEYSGQSRNSALSFRLFMHNNLFKFIDINLQNTFFPDNPTEYDQKLDNIKQFDFTLLGLGRNGHIAFNEPGSDYLRTHEVKLTTSTIADNFGEVTDYPTEAITMGLKDIYEKSAQIILIAWGENKKQALKVFKQALIDKKKDSNWPLTYLIDHPNFRIYTDQII